MKKYTKKEGHSLQEKDEARASDWTTVYVLRANPDTIRPHGMRIPEPCSAVIKTRGNARKQTNSTSDSICITT
ncbi:hypothetical protein ASPTUDRAFT_48461 [Aspergillus tubingensis CBS 134.48]|uniref:Uncharacterized protein n=1 Tax=Aspergillus tubingensis (strain CBS 134.48) TaxID=767770 RepID=A0A1L9MSB2_ASPTC|nr:hypothetical protein ASPTUDRAFT_48461 [Aspergillus tubingensis CBS 134.48]